MSSRALRKAQRELEERQQLEKLQAENEEDEESEEEPTPAPISKASLFAMLDAEDEDVENEESPTAQSDEEEDVNDKTSVAHDSAPRKPAKRKKKKKGKGGKNGEALHPKGVPVKSEQLDEIDQALKSLSMKPPKALTDSTQSNAVDPEIEELCHLVAVDTQHLHAANEMRRLFGRAALEANNDEDEAVGAGRGRRRARGQQRGGIAGAVAGRNGPGGRGLTGLALRRNIFIQGKEDWPPAAGSGLGMEIVEKRAGGTVEYRFVHSRGYQDVQAQFCECVASMDPERMIQLLRLNPYHISTTLQVSEIAKQERDHATSGDLLERALFSFGRSVHSTFASNLSQGKARLNFRRPENREFWLAASRYINNLGMRATWRTVFEWAKLLLSLDPEDDPYQLYLVLDQYALRARRQQEFIDLAQSSFFKARWSYSPNIGLSYGLALYQTNQPQKSRDALRQAIEKWPWVAGRLFQELDLKPLPPSIWGKLASGSLETLETELYALRAKDIWNTPEATSFLSEVAFAADTSKPQDFADTTLPISVDLARHVILTDKPELIALVPPALTSQITSSSDPLPPVDNLASYSIQRPPRTGLPLTQADPSTLRTFFERLGGIFGLPGAGGREADGDVVLDADSLRQRMQESGISEEEMMQLLSLTQDMGGAFLDGEVDEGLDMPGLVMATDGADQGSDGDSDMPELEDVDDTTPASRQARVEDAEDDGGI